MMVGSSIRALALVACAAALHERAAADAPRREARDGGCVAPGTCVAPAAATHAKVISSGPTPGPAADEAEAPFFALSRTPR